MKTFLASLCVSMLLGALMLVAPTQPAAAQQVIDEVCVDGVYVDGSCQVRSNAAPECEPDACVVEVARPSVPRTDPPTVGPDTCPDGALGVVDACFIYVAKKPDDSCPRGSVERGDGNCGQPVANKRGPYLCGEGRLGTLGPGSTGLTCVYDNDRVFGFCPTGSEPFNGICATFVVEGLSATCGLRNEDFQSARCIEPAAPNPAGAQACAAGTQFVNQACVVAADGLVTEACAFGLPRDKFQVLAGERCLLTVEPLITQCPVGFSRDSSLSGRCYQFFDAAETAAGTPACQVGVLSNDGTACFAPARLSATGLAACADGLLTSTSQRCYSWASALPGPLACPTNALGPINACYFDVTPVSCSAGMQFGDLCLVVTNDQPVETDPFCPISNTVFADGDSCYIILTRLPSQDGSPGVCPTVSVDHVSGECRREIPLRPGPLVCQAAARFLIDGQCYMQVPADVPDSCPAGSTAVASTGQCRRAVPARPSFYFCADDSAILVDSSCAIDEGAPVSVYCPEGYAISRVEPGCLLFEDAVPGPAACPANALGSVGNCYIDVTPRTCSEGREFGDGCIVETDPPLRTPDTCPVSTTVFLDGDLCYAIRDRSASGNCPSNTIEVQGECRLPVSIQRGTLACQDPSHAYISGKCYVWVAADQVGGACPEGSTSVAGQCRRPVADIAEFYVCPSGGTLDAERARCEFRVAFLADPPQGNYVCNSGVRTVAGVGPGSVTCVFGTPTTDATRSCPDDAALNGRVCVLGADFVEVVCPSGFALIGGTECQGEVGPNNAYSCTTYGDFVTFAADGTPACLTPSGPQPGACPGTTINGQCYAFVDHTLSCAPGGCLVSVPAQAAAPLAERGDVDCDGQRDVRDALAIARALSEPTRPRETVCAAVVTGGGIRVTAGDLARDGNVDRLDAQQLLQCLVDGTIGSCEG